MPKPALELLILPTGSVNGVELQKKDQPNALRTTPASVILVEGTTVGQGFVLAVALCMATAMPN